MDFELKTLTPHQAVSSVADALVVLWPTGSGQSTPGADPLSVWAQTALRERDLDPKAGKALAGHRLPGIKPRRVVLAPVELGTPAQVSKALLAALSQLKSASCKSLVVVAPGLSPEGAQAAVQTLGDASYSYTTTQSKAQPRELRKVVLAVTNARALQPAFDQAVAVFKGVELAKEWANRPPNHSTPTQLALAAKQLAKHRNLTVEVLGPKEVAKLRMGAFMAVSQGSEEPLRFVVMRYQGAGKTEAPVVLVGKGITFDTGGISLKPAPEMDEMKYDMGGAASVLGTFAALGELQPAINVVGLIPACENMPDGRAVKPGDVVTSMSGQTIEILNTDAEGRLILCDALTYATRFKPTALIDIATLTGACVIALGGLRAGLYANRDDLAQALLDAGQASRDLCWRMPLDDEYGEGLKSNFADMGNVAGRQAGSVTAAKFLQKFVQDGQPWAHLDIAGVAWKSGAAKGATGRPVPLLVSYLLQQAKRPVAKAATPSPAKSSAKPKPKVKASKATKASARG